MNLLRFPLKLIAIVASLRIHPCSQGRIIPQIASKKHCDTTSLIPLRCLGWISGSFPTMFARSCPSREAPQAATESSPAGLRADVHRLHVAVVELHHRQAHRRRHPWHRPGGRGRDGRGELTDVQPHR
jgi:hypothetical protein